MFFENVHLIYWIRYLNTACFFVLYSILVLCFSFEYGVNVKLFSPNPVNGEKSTFRFDHVVEKISLNNLNTKIIARSADNTNTTFGGIKRKGENNVQKRSMQLLNKNDIGIGSNAHILTGNL